MIRNKLLRTVTIFLVLVSIFLSLDDYENKPQLVVIGDAVQVAQARKDAPELRDWNSTGDFNPDGTISKTFRQKWVNYLDELNNWQRIDPTFVDTGSEFAMEAAPFFAYAPKTSGGQARFVNNNRIDPHDKKKQIDEPVLTQTLQALGTADVPGEVEIGNLGWGDVQYIVYKGAYADTNADLIYWVHDGTVPSLKKLIRFNSNPLHAFTDGTYELSFVLSYDQNVEFTRSNGVKWGEASDLTYKGRLTNRMKNGSLRGNTLEPVKIWDSTPDSIASGTKQKVQEIDFKVKKIKGGKEYQLIKIIPDTFFVDATYPVYTDTTTTFYPDDGSTTIDGMLLEDCNSGTFLQCQASTDANTVDTIDPMEQIMYDYVGSNNYNVGRAVIMVDGSSIPDAETINSITSGVMSDGTNNVNNASLSLNIYSASTTSATSLTGTDFAKANFGTTAWATDVTAASIITTGADVYIVWTWNSTGIAAFSKTGITKFGIRYTADASDTDMNSRNYLGKWYTSDHTGTSGDPYVTVNYGSASNRHTIIN